MLGTYSTCFSHPFYEFRGLNLQRHKESSNHQIFVHGTYVILKTSEGFYLYSFLQITIWFYLGNSLKSITMSGRLERAYCKRFKRNDEMTLHAYCEGRDT
jgi:hypothetical protein